MVGTSLGSSRLWFTLAGGIVTELYYPRIDIPQIKESSLSLVWQQHGPDKVVTEFGQCQRTDQSAAGV